MLARSVAINQTDEEVLNSYFLNCGHQLDTPRVWVFLWSSGLNDDTKTHYCVGYLLSPIKHASDIILLASSSFSTSIALFLYLFLGLSALTITILAKSFTLSQLTSTLVFVSCSPKLCRSSQVRDNATLVLSRVPLTQQNYDQNQENHEERKHVSHTLCSVSDWLTLKRWWSGVNLRKWKLELLFLYLGFSQHPHCNLTCKCMLFYVLLQHYQK